MDQKPFKTRFFNAITHDPLGGMVTKTSLNKAALRNEINWYRSLPPALSKYHPRVLSSCTGETPFITMEYLRLPVLGELFASERCHAYDWPSILHTLLDTVQEFSSYAAPDRDEKSVYDMAVTKTARRIEELLRVNRVIAGYYGKREFALNGKWLLCPISWFLANSFTVARLAERPLLHLIHGDLHFSNIFYDCLSGRIKLIDPRGSFGKYAIHGDPCYDLGKIRHSLSGYEHIVHDQFAVDFDSSGIELRMGRRGVHEEAVRLWDELTAAVSWKVKLWEILSFLSLLPLHEDTPRRQLAFYAMTACLIEDFISG